MVGGVAPWGERSLHPSRPRDWNPTARRTAPPQHRQPCVTNCASASYRSLARSDRPATRPAASGDRTRRPRRCLLVVARRVPPVFPTRLLLVARRAPRAVPPPGRPAPPLPWGL